ncbi:hypothetical protein [Streptomyces sp. NBC_00893]|uniref:hypothetical protein n=1 Tax=Streptomyces sp. NBC_00893 TaxID=2975862 RepID=UPI0022581D8D|nr:hypothetical protein [Streptomyces sp. NBC_00893]MCX4848909.1 hypothetical protein [Streptomyces sp. NBC_00893]
MPTQDANRDSRLSFWARVREFAVPPSMIETATARRHVGDWAGACAAAGVDADIGPRSVAHTHGREVASRIRDDLRHLAPDLLRWHLPRIAPRGLLRPGLTVALARYDTEGPDGARPVHLVVRTPPAWADAGQRIELALWDGADPATEAHRHPHHRPNPRFRLDLHRHLWDARRAGELRVRSGADGPPDDRRAAVPPEVLGAVPSGLRCAVGRWADEAGILLRAGGRSAGTVTVRFGARRRLLLDLVPEESGPGMSGMPGIRIAAATTTTDGSASALPVLPDAATWVLPDLELLRTGAIEAGRLHPLVLAALAPGHVPTAAAPADRAGQPRLVECRGARHRIGLVDGVLAPLDHDPTELRREELLVALTGTPLPCLQAIDEAHRRPDCLTGVRERLDHGDITGALAVVEGLLGPGALLRSGELRDELEAAARRRITYGLFRAGLAEGPARLHPYRSRPRRRRSRPRDAVFR